MYIEGKPIIIMLGISMEYAWKVVECGMEYDVMGLGGGGWGGEKDDPSSLRIITWFLIFKN